MRFRLTFLVFFIALAAAAPARSDSPSVAPLAQQIRSLLDAASALPSDAELQRFYANRNYAPAWTDPAAVSTLRSILAGAIEQGLPASFALADRQKEGPSAARDIALTRAALAYATSLARGRVDPEGLETDWAIRPPVFDGAKGLADALRNGLAAWYARLEPSYPAYRNLVAALARYRAMPEWAPIPRGAPLKLGMNDERVRALRLRLEAEGDLARSSTATVATPIVRVAAIVGTAEADPSQAASGPPDPETYFDGAVEAAVRRFQHRYGIAVDGTVGPRTLAAMNVPLRARIAQIELNLERWRTLPHDLGTSYIAVNVPAETLEVVEEGVPVISMKVVVGDPDHPTPVVRTSIVALTVNPTWTIPTSIVTNEIMPKAARDHAYLSRNDIVFTPGRGWQQMPGPKNPLGQIKFETPNRFDVYLHDTPSKFAFDRYFRAQSHGCVRLENAAELAGFLLRGAGWNELQISQAVASGESRHIDIRHRWRVWLLYATSFVDDAGRVEFRDDFYGRDARLREALSAERAAQKQARFWPLLLPGKPS